MILFQNPVNVTAFENAYTDFLKYVEQMPGITRRQVANISGSPTGEPRYYRILEVYFDSQEAMQEALNSDAGQLAGASMHHFVRGSFEMMFAQVYEEEGGQTVVSEKRKVESDE